MGGGEQNSIECARNFKGHAHALQRSLVAIEGSHVTVVLRPEMRNGGKHAQLSILEVILGSLGSRDRVQASSVSLLLEIAPQFQSFLAVPLNNHNYAEVSMPE